jgi:hypothetical protein
LKKEKARWKRRKDSRKPTSDREARMQKKNGKNTSGTVEAS